MSRLEQLVTLCVMFVMLFVALYLPPLVLFKILPATFPFLKEFFIWITLLLVVGCTYGVRYTSTRKTMETKNDSPKIGDEIN